MLHPPEARLTARSSPRRVAREATRALARMARPTGDFDSSRYFRASGDLGFYNVGTAAMRGLARSIHAQHKDSWSVDAQAHVTVVEKRMQGRDHPVLLGVPETYYLKCFILRKVV